MARDGSSVGPMWLQLRLDGNGEAAKGVAGMQGARSHCQLLWNLPCFDMFQKVQDLVVKWLFLICPIHSDSRSWMEPWVLVAWILTETYFIEMQVSVSCCKSWNMLKACWNILNMFKAFRALHQWNKLLTYMPKCRHLSRVSSPQSRTLGHKRLLHRIETLYVDRLLCNTFFLKCRKLFHSTFTANCATKIKAVPRGLFLLVLPSRSTSHTCWHFLVALHFRMFDSRHVNLLICHVSHVPFFTLNLTHVTPHWMIETWNPGAGRTPWFTCAKLGSSAQIRG